MADIVRMNKLTQYMENYTERRAQDIIKLRNAGITYRVIGARWGISRQRAQQIYSGYIPREAALAKKIKALADISTQENIS